MLDPGSRTCKPVLEEYLKCRAATWSSRDMLDLIRQKTAAGEAASPSDGPSTSAASTPKGERGARAGPGGAGLRLPERAPPLGQGPERQVS